MSLNKERYENLDGMRAYACIGIVLMHVLSNGGFGVSGFVFDRFIPSLTNFTFFFMLLSAFSMCCGYYERFKNGSISLDQFYKRRFARIWPFFAILCTVELILDHSLSSLYEWFADLTLAFGLLPNANISVVGVGWFLGVLFAFYMMFPFFVFLMGNKKRAWMTLGITVVFNILCQLYFFDKIHVIEDFSARSNLIYSAMFFVAGGLIYLYREKIRELPWIKWLALLAIVTALILYYAVSSSVFVMLLIFILLCILGITVGGGTAKVLFQNKTVRFLASISMEIYLCHMFVFRVIEKAKLIHATSNDSLNYFIVCFATFVGAIAYSYVLRKIIDRMSGKLRKA